jgi:hypothetical protein
VAVMCILSCHFVHFDVRDAREKSSQVWRVGGRDWCDRRHWARCACLRMYTQPRFLRLMYSYVNDVVQPMLKCWRRKA